MGEKQRGKSKPAESVGFFHGSKGPEPSQEADGAFSPENAGGRGRQPIAGAFQAPEGGLVPFIRPSARYKNRPFLSGRFFAFAIYFYGKVLFPTELIRCPISAIEVSDRLKQAAQRIVNQQPQGNAHHGGVKQSEPERFTDNRVVHGGHLRKPLLIVLYVIPPLDWGFFVNCKRNVMLR